jgi:hypothetical protein
MIDGVELQACLNQQLMWGVIMLCGRSVLLRSLIALLLAVSMAPVARAVSWFDDFNDGNAEDGNPVTWTYNESGFTPGIYDASSGDYVLSNPGGSSDDSLVATVNTNFTDVHVRAQAVVLPGMSPEQVGGTLGVVARFDPATVSGYVAILSNGAHLQVLRADFGGPLNLAEERNLPIDTITDAMIELSIVGDLLSVYLWRPDEPKPAEPIVTVNDSTYTSGRAGIVHNENHDSVRGAFRFVAAQDTPFVDTLAGDFNNDGSVDAADYVVWRKNLGTQEDYNLWRANFGRPSKAAAAVSQATSPAAAVPEASSVVLVLLGAALYASPFRRRYRAHRTYIR